jgi:DNA polymerase III gamma/tau subunit
VRDGLSILDQAIAHADLDGGGMIGAAQVRVMLGLSDRSAIGQLMASILDGDAGAAIDLARAQYALGIEPVAMVRGLMDLTHAVTLAKVSRHDDPALAEADRERIGDWAQKLGFAPLNRLWQLLLKGHDEVLRANNPLEHLEMLLLRVIYAAVDARSRASSPNCSNRAGFRHGLSQAPAASSGQESMAAEPVAAAEAPAATARCRNHPLGKRRFTGLGPHRRSDSSAARKHGKSSACGRCLRSSANHHPRTRQHLFLRPAVRSARRSHAIWAKRCSPQTGSRWHVAAGRGRGAAQSRRHPRRDARRQ